MDRDRAGCLVLEGTGCLSHDARGKALALCRPAEAVIRDYIALRHSSEVGEVADFVTATMIGLSAKARNGHSLAQLLATSRIAEPAISQALQR